MTVFTKLPYWSPALCHSTDAMHLVSNIHKTLLRHWTSGIIPASKWKQLDKELTAQKIHGVFNRKVRSLLDDGPYYKCSESMSFILYLSPLLKRYLSTRYYAHHILLVEGLTVLYKESISMQELDEVMSIGISFISNISCSRSNAN